MAIFNSLGVISPQPALLFLHLTLTGKIISKALLLAFLVLLC